MMQKCFEQKWFLQKQLVNGTENQQRFTSNVSYDIEKGNWNYVRAISAQNMKHKQNQMTRQNFGKLC